MTVMKIVWREECGTVRSSWFVFYSLLIAWPWGVFSHSIAEVDGISLCKMT